MDRPGLQRLLADIAAGRVNTIVVYKIDRLTRSLADFAKIVEILDARGASFVSVTQQFNTTTSMGRLTWVPSWQPHDSLRSSRGRAPQRSRSIRIHRNARCEPRRCAAASCVSVSCRATSPGEHDPAPKN